MLCQTQGHAKESQNQMLPSRCSSDGFSPLQGCANSECDRRPLFEIDLAGKAPPKAPSPIAEGDVSTGTSSIIEGSPSPSAPPLLLLLLLAGTCALRESFDT
mmetsp:Transcript_22252/g.44133  ORF Transcript_22252/g.44133 Transcript_22252/m.44133 type:complete len:102 (-) Transcript_22252:760-1065(-)